MNDELRNLLELARPGQPDPFQQLVGTLRLLTQDDVRLLIEFADASDELQRRAAISAAAGRTEPEVLEAITKLANDPIPYVRQCLAYALTDYPSWPMKQAIEVLLADLDSNVRQSAIWAAKPRPELTPALVQRLALEPNNWVRNDLANALGDCAARLVLGPLVMRLAEDADGGVQQSVRSRRGKEPDCPGQLSPRRAASDRKGVE